MTIKTPQQVRKAERVDMPTLTLLQRAIYEAAAPIFHAPDVKEYQKRMQREMARGFWVRHFAPSFSVAVCLTGGFGYAGFRLFKYVLRNIASGSWSPHSELLPLAGLCVALLFCGAAISFKCVSLLWSKRHSTDLAHWESSPWSDYAQPRHLPETIRRRVKMIRKFCPSAACTVEYLAEDPFLRVQHGGEAYYVGVWDETGFVG